MLFSWTKHEAVPEWLRQLGLIVDFIVDEAIHKPILGEEALDEFQKVIYGDADGVPFLPSCRASPRGQAESKRWVISLTEFCECYVSRK